jgi:hypothetical protein
MTAAVTTIVIAIVVCSSHSTKNGRNASIQRRRPRCAARNRSAKAMAPQQIRVTARMETSQPPATHRTASYAQISAGGYLKSPRRRPRARATLPADPAAATTTRMRRRLMNDGRAAQASQTTNSAR